MDSRGPAIPQLLLQRTAGKRKPALIEKDALVIGAGHSDQARSRVQFLLCV